MKKIVMHKRKGVLIVEILVVVVIISLLTLLEIPDTPIVRNRGWGMDERRKIAFMQLREIEYALDIYRKHNGLYPTTEQGLEALITKPTTDPQPENYLEGGYLKKLPTDPWGNPFIYRSYGEEGQIDIISCGPDGEEGTEDDITNHIEKYTKKEVSL